MYVPNPEDPHASGGWTSLSRQTPRNHFQRASRVIKWRYLRNVQHLADGAMCSCYTAELEGFGIVVVKKPSDHSNETREEIERELDIEKAYLANLRHPHIVRLIGSGQRGLKNHFEPFLVLEYLAGGTLGHLITERRRGGGATVEEGVNRRRGAFELPHFVLDGKKNYVPWAQAMGWARDIASALRYMHEEASEGHMYICRDLKPDNIGFTADGTLKIFDFGLAKRLKRKSGIHQQYTMTSRTGTVRYMAPEAFLGCLYNEKVDVYAWSHVVAEMLSLDVPYNHMTTKQFREAVALGSRRPNIERRWPRSVQRLLRRCWNANPMTRPSFNEILEDGVLDQAAGPSHPWLHYFGIHRPSVPAPEWKEAAAKVAAGEPVEPLPSVPPVLEPPVTRGRTATVDESRILQHHMSGREKGVEAGQATGTSHSRSISTPARFRLGPLNIPFCFFGGRSLNQHDSERKRDPSEASGDDAGLGADQSEAGNGIGTEMRGDGANGGGVSRGGVKSAEIANGAKEELIRPFETAGVAPAQMRAGERRSAGW